jgi:hypothetical protein
VRVLLLMGFVKFVGCFLLVCMCVCRFMSFMFILWFFLFVGIVEGLFCIDNLCVFIIFFIFIFLPFILFFWARPVGRACLSLVVWLF